MTLEHLPRERWFRELTPQVLGAVTRRFRDFSASEDAVQEALLAAALQWPKDGIPDNPRGWLIQVASRKMTDAVRADRARRQREAIVVSLVPLEQQLALAADDDDFQRKDALDVLFLCCPPILSPASAIALALRAAVGLTTLEIARAFFVPGRARRAPRCGDPCPLRDVRRGLCTERRRRGRAR